MDLFGYVANDPVDMVDSYGLWGINYGGSLMGIDFSATLYDSNKGWFIGTKTDIGVSTTALGGGLQFTFNTPVDSKRCPKDDLNITPGILSKYLGFTYNIELSRGSVNIGLGLGLPVSFSTSIENFVQGLSQSIQKIFK